MTKMENSLPSHHRHVVESVIARKTSAASAALVDIRFDSYNPHDEKIPWQSRMAIANNAQLTRLTLVVKRWVIVVQLYELVLKRAANPNETMISPMSTTMRARKAIPRMISCALEPI